VAAALHAGHAVRKELQPLLALSPDERLREEDPHTDAWTAIARTSIVAGRSRFEVDFNRPRHQAVYQTPSDAWGLSVWRQPLPADVLARSLVQHEEFYQVVENTMRDIIGRHGRVVVFDLHSYNHLREGAHGVPADSAENPEVNIGTGTMVRSRWAVIVDRVITELHNFDFLGRRMDVRENVKFQGGYFPRWIHETFPINACAIAIEFKKFFMNEWTGQADVNQLNTIRQALEAAADGVLQELDAT
jgi:N-formylglutamate amidohydrolase